MDYNAYELISALVGYGLDRGLVRPADRSYVINSLLDAMRLNGYSPSEPRTLPLEDILDGLLTTAIKSGIIEDTPGQRDLFDTRLMGCLTPPPSAVADRFWQLYGESPEAATDWFYRFSGDCNYIRTARCAKDRRWTVGSKYGEIELSINLAKPEKDPRDIAASAGSTGGYPACMLCAENEGYAGRIDFPARQNLRIIPLKLNGAEWGLQYSPYVYYNEHCIVLSCEHRPMRIDETTFHNLFSFIERLPHYFIGSNADLPIVGGSILGHEHYQGGRHVFPMERADKLADISFNGYSDVEASVLHWPLSVIRLRGGESGRLSALAAEILKKWRSYSDPDADIIACTGGTPHNTITPIARFKNGKYELDLVLRNNRTSERYPLGIFHPHQEYHHIKKENIGLIEVMGLAVLPARLDRELEAVKQCVLDGTEPEENPLTASHAEWIRSRLSVQDINAANIASVIENEVGRIFVGVLEDAGVFKSTEDGLRAFMRFIDNVNN